MLSILLFILSITFVIARESSLPKIIDLSRAANLSQLSKYQTLDTSTALF